LAANNYHRKHSLLCTIDPFTDTGIYGSLKLNNPWTVQPGLSGGHDVALWTPNDGKYACNYRHDYITYVAIYLSESTASIYRIKMTAA
jgi:hypothetical protein